MSRETEISRATSTEKSQHAKKSNTDQLKNITGLFNFKSVFFQANLGLRPIPAISALASVNRTTFPVVWFDEYATLPEELQAEYVSSITKPLNIVDGVSIGIGLVFGSLLILGGCVCCWFG